MLRFWRKSDPKLLSLYCLFPSSFHPKFLLLCVLLAAYCPPSFHPTKEQLILSSFVLKYNYVLAPEGLEDYEFLGVPTYRCQSHGLILGEAQEGLLVDIVFRGSSVKDGVLPELCSSGYHTLTSIPSLHHESWDSTWLLLQFARKHAATAMNLLHQNCWSRGVRNKGPWLKGQLIRSRRWAFHRPPAHLFCYLLQ